ncbi:pyruvate-formate lyase [Haematococcus lacustris]
MSSPLMITSLLGAPCAFAFAPALSHALSRLGVAALPQLSANLPASRPRGMCRVQPRMLLGAAGSTRALSAAAEAARLEESPLPPIARSSQSAKSPSPVPTINVAKFIAENFTAYQGDASFLATATPRTQRLWSELEHLIHKEQEKGVLDVDPSKPSTITAFGPGYIDQALEKIVGLQTDAPLKRAIKPLGGINMVKAALEAYGYTPDPHVEELYTKVRKTHNSGVFDTYTAEMRAARKASLLTGLPDGYGRGRIIGDYRRVALYGVDALIADKKKDLKHNLVGVMDEERIRLREEVSDQIRALNELKQMAASYGHDVSKPAQSAQEAVQWLYYGYLGAVKEQDGAAMSMGRIDAFLDIFFERDLAANRITEAEAQELIDDFVIKLRIVRQLRTPEYNGLFAGDPTWVTCGLGGTDSCGKSMVTKTSFRILQTLYNLGPAPEPNLTVLWAANHPQGFKEFCARVSLDTSSIQYENDAMMSKLFGSDYGIACCVSAMNIGKDMQFFGARANLPKLLLYVMNEGRDEVSGDQVGPKFAPLHDKTAPLDFEEVKAKLEAGMEWLAGLYCNTMNVIHYMHDKYNYERLQMALHDTHVRRLLAFGISGLSVVADSLSAIKYAKVTPILNDKGIAVDFKVEGEFPKYGNDEDKADEIATWVATTFSEKLSKQHTYRNSIPTLSVLTITSNVVYGKKTGSTPDGRKAGQPFAPGANPLHGRDASGALASLNSVAKLPYGACLDGVSNTFCLVPQVLGKGGPQDRARNLSAVLDGYFQQGGHHLNVNVLSREMLQDAMDHPENYPSLTIRVSGYAVHFAKLTREQQMEVIARTFHDNM